MARHPWLDDGILLRFISRCCLVGLLASDGKSNRIIGKHYCGDGNTNLKLSFVLYPALGPGLGSFRLAWEATFVLSIFVCGPLICKLMVE